MARGLCPAWMAVGFACLAAALVGLGTAPAVAQSSEKSAREQALLLAFQRFDGNGDGKVTSAEFLKVGKQDLQAFDLNKDGKVSKEEFLDPKPHHLVNASAADLAQAKQIWAKQFDSLDTDKNGVLSDAEHENAGKRSFARMDKNKDGAITLAEMSAAAK
jgi:Ca2+-binding EF-hand superfamily protein